MESDLKPAAPKVAETNKSSSLKSEPGGKMVPKVNLPSTDKGWQDWVDQIFEFLAKVPDYLAHFFSDYKKPLGTLGLIVLGAVTVYITLAVLDAVNDIPLLAPIFEVVGMGYTGWFVYRYLLRESSRAELLTEFDALKSQVVGKNSQDS